MYRRRRPSREKIVFSFDSFLDVVANVNGIIIRLILVAFVGARAYHSAMAPVDEPLPKDDLVANAPPPPKVEDDPLAAVLAKQRHDLNDLRMELAKKAALGQNSTSGVKEVDSKLAALTALKDAVAKQKAAVVDAAARESRELQTVALTLEELAQRTRDLKKAVADVEAIAPPRKELRYHVPVSKTVTSDELFFECKHGRVTYLDLPGMMKDIEETLKEREEQLRDRFSVEDVTRPSGAFRLKYTIERRKGLADSFGGDGSRPRDRIYFGYGLGRFVVEPIAPLRGETLEQALRPNSDFRQSVDGLDSQTVVTFWVYPDSFAIFRTLRDYLHDKNVEVAGRPLPENEPIGGSPNGTRSRGQ